MVFQGTVTTFGDDIFEFDPINSLTYSGVTYTGASPQNDACFSFTPASNTITDYKLYDMNLLKTSGVACMKRDVAIPASIDGVAVTTIGDYAFGYNKLTSVTIPNSVTTILGDSFTWNELTSITIPHSVTSLGSWAFYKNRLTSVSIPDSLTYISYLTFAYNRITEVTIPNSVTKVEASAFAYQSPRGIDLYEDLYSADPIVQKAAADSIWYVRLYTEDTSNPNNLKSEAVFYGPGKNGGGFIVNPASVTLNYVDTMDEKLQQSVSYIGQTPDDNMLTDYLVSRGPIIQSPANSYSPTPAESQAIQDALSVYWHIGQTVTFTAPDVAGYITPSPATRSYVLGASTNNFAMIYTQPGQSSATGTSAGGQLLETGVRVASIATASILVMFLSLRIFLKQRSRYQIVR